MIDHKKDDWGGPLIKSTKTFSKKNPYTRKSWFALLSVGFRPISYGRGSIFFSSKGFYIYTTPTDTNTCQNASVPCEEKACAWHLYRYGLCHSMYLQALNFFFTAVDVFAGSPTINHFENIFDRTFNLESTSFTALGLEEFIKGRYLILFLYNLSR